MRLQETKLDAERRIPPHFGSFHGLSSTATSCRLLHQFRSTEDLKRSTKPGQLGGSWLLLLHRPISGIHHPETSQVSLSPYGYLNILVLSTQGRTCRAAITVLRSFKYDDDEVGPSQWHPPGLVRSRMPASLIRSLLFITPSGFMRPSTIRSTYISIAKYQHIP